VDGNRPDGHVLGERWNVVTLRSRTHAAAARHAAEAGWWLHAWSWEGGPDAPAQPEEIWHDAEAEAEAARSRRS
jgi:hypothetical protein